MTQEINSKNAVIAYAKHLDGSRHNPDLDSYAGARRSLESTLAHSLRDFSSNGLIKDATKLEDFELIGLTDRVLKRDEAAMKGFKHGFFAAGATTVVGVAGFASVGWAFGVAAAATVFAAGTAKAMFEFYSHQRSEKKTSALVHTIAQERTPSAPTVSEKPAPIGPR